MYKLTHRLLILSFLLYSNIALCQLFNPFPGTVVFESKEDPIKKRVGSPSILILTNGDYLISHSYNKSVSIHLSKDKGKTWKKISKVAPLIWSNLFEHKGNVYLMGTAKGWGDMVIYQSKNNGKDWSNPKNENTGLLAKGLFHTAPVPIIKHKGKIWRAYEEAIDADNKRDFHAFAIVANENADLLKASSWQRTNNSIRFDETWLNARRPNWLEGNIVVTPEGKLIDFMRLETWAGKNVDYEVEGMAKGKPRNEIAAIIDIDEKNMKMEFKNEPRNFVHFPGAESKFTIRYDSVSKSYWAITNKITSQINSEGSYDGNWNQRNLLVLLNSKDLKTWKVKRKILKWNEGIHLKTWDTFGFQYVDWQFENNDIVFVSRTSWYGFRYHDANMITFDRVENFRNKASKPVEDLIKYTEHPTLLTINSSNIKQEIFSKGDFKVSIKLGYGIKKTEQGGYRLNVEKKSAKNVKSALKMGRYFDVEIKNKEDNNFSIETLKYMVEIDVEGFKLKWLYSTDGVTYQPITKYYFPLSVELKEYNKLAPPLYLQIYKPLNKINGNKGAILRCIIVGGSKLETTINFNEDIIIGGRAL